MPYSRPCASFGTGDPVRTGIYLTRNEVRLRQFRAILRQAQLALEDARREGKPEHILEHLEGHVCLELSRTYGAEDSVRRERECGPALRHALADQMTAL